MTPPYVGPLDRRERNRTSRKHRHDALNAKDQMTLIRLRRRYGKLISDSNLLLAFCIVFLARGQRRHSIATLLLTLVCREDLRIVEGHIRHLLVTHTANRPLAVLPARLAWRNKDASWLDNNTGFESFEDLRRFFVQIGLGWHSSFIGSKRNRYDAQDCVIYLLMLMRGSITFVVIEGILHVDSRKVGEMFALANHYLYVHFARKLSKKGTLARYGTMLDLFKEKIRLKCLKPVIGRGYEFPPDDFDITFFTDAFGKESLRPGSGPAEQGVGARRYKEAYATQRAFYSGYTKTCGLKYLLVNTPHGMTALLHGPESNRRSDPHLVKSCRLEKQLRNLSAEFLPQGQKAKCYGDSIFKITIFVQGPHNPHLYSDDFQDANEEYCADLLAQDRTLSAVRISAEWIIAVAQNKFPLVGDKKKFKLMSTNKLQPAKSQINVVVFLTDVMTALYGNQISKYFDCAPPSLEEYFAGLNSV